MLSKLRKLDESITQKIKTMPIFTEAMIKDHALYKEGEEAGMRKIFIETKQNLENLALREKVWVAKNCFLS